jgi:Arc/MetJ family transcription regulator
MQISPHTSIRPPYISTPQEEAYSGSKMKRTAGVRRTTLNLPEDLLHAAQEALGTTGVRDTVVRAMEEAVRFHLRLRLLRRELPDLTPELVERLREPRTAAGEDEGDA